MKGEGNSQPHNLNTIILNAWTKFPHVGDEPIQTWDQGIVKTVCNKQHSYDPGFSLGRCVR